MSSLRRLLLITIGPLYALAVTVLIFVSSGSPYEFMIGEVENNKKITICDLPASADDARDVYALATGALVIVLLVVGILRSIRSRRIRPSFVLGCIVLALWVYRFFLWRC